MESINPQNIELHTITLFAPYLWVSNKAINIFWFSKPPPGNFVGVSVGHLNRPKTLYCEI